MIHLGRPKLDYGKLRMTQFKVFITRKIPRAGIQILEEAGYDVETYSETKPLSKTMFLKKIANTDAIIAMLSEEINKEVLEHAPKLKVIANYAVGYNNIDVEYAHSKNIHVTNTPDVLTEATADLTWALILGVTKRIAEADQFVRQGHFKGWHPMMMLGGDLECMFYIIHQLRKNNLNIRLACADVSLMNYCKQQIF